MHLTVIVCLVRKQLSCLLPLFARICGTSYSWPRLALRHDTARKQKSINSFPLCLWVGACVSVCVCVVGGVHLIVVVVVVYAAAVVSMINAASRKVITTQLTGSEACLL